MGGGGGHIDSINLFGGGRGGCCHKGVIIAEVSLRERTRSYQEVTARHLANAHAGQLERTVLSAKASSCS